MKSQRKVEGNYSGTESVKDKTVLHECINECCTGKSAALVLPANEILQPVVNSNSKNNPNCNHSRYVSGSGPDIQQHLQSMFYLLRPEETLKMAVKLESAHSGRTRYLVVVSCVGRQNAEESCLLGIDCNENTTVGLVLRVLADTAITLDGDGGFSVSVCGRQHIFKPVSVQAMWSALQTLHKVSAKAREQNYFMGGLTHDWVSYYEQRIESDRSCLNEWHAMDNLESRRPPSPDSERTKPREREETEHIIRCTLKEIMMSVDLDEVTSKYIRSRLEEDLDMDLGEFKPFIDQEMLTILGQMDAATEIFDHVYLGSEWNASNLEELQKNGVHHILNVTREIDNFFPGMFNYLNIRVYDDEKTDLLKHWDNTFKYITGAKKEGSKVLVHCKMGVSRSASVVIAYAMKAYNWDFKEAFKYVKQKRNCIKPNSSFISQLETYQGILDAMKNREKLQRSKSETNLKSPSLVAKAEQRAGFNGARDTITKEAVLGSESHLLNIEWTTSSGEELSKIGERPKSWSPDNGSAALLFVGNATVPTSVSLEHLNLGEGSSGRHGICIENTYSQEESVCDKNTNANMQKASCLTFSGMNLNETTHNYNLNVRMPCGNGQAYSVSQNKIVYLPVSCQEEVAVPSVKHRVSELELQHIHTDGTSNKKMSLDKKRIVLNLSKFEPCVPKFGSFNKTECIQDIKVREDGEQMVQTQTKPVPKMLTAVLVKKEIWDPGEKKSPTVYAIEQISQSSVQNCSDQLVWSSEVGHKLKSEDTVFVSELKIREIESGKVNKTLRREGDPFSTQLDRVFEREERKQQRLILPPAASLSTTLLAPCVSELSVENSNRECPSRQSSWSSYDSAVVLGFQGEVRDAPSRQSSWGSGDTKFAYAGEGALPSRNSSWGSYDMQPTTQYVSESGQNQKNLDDLFVNSYSGMFPYDRDEIPWYPGTVKRTKQKLEEGTNAVKRVCSHSQPSATLTVGNQDVRTEDPSIGITLKVHGPRPYQSPSSERRPVTCYSVLSPNSRVPVNEDNTFKTQGPVMVHCASSPTLSSYKDMDNKHDIVCTSLEYVDKITPSQPNVTFLNSETVRERFTPPVSIIQEQTDFKNEVAASPVCSLSVSAPTASSFNILKCHQPLKPPSYSLPSVSSACLITNNQFCESLCETSPYNINLAQCTSVKQQRKELQKLTYTSSKLCVSGDSSVDITKDNVSLKSPELKEKQINVSGLVKNLKKEFEAKSTHKKNERVCFTANETDSKQLSDSLKAQSLPSSPVSSHSEIKSPGNSSPSSESFAEDLSVKMLVGKYEVNKSTRASIANKQTEVVTRKMLQQPPVPVRKSSLEIPFMQNNSSKNSPLLVCNLHNESKGPEKRPPLIPSSVCGHSSNVVVASVMSKASIESQKQDKTHPLVHLKANKPCHTNTIYNTM